MRVRLGEGEGGREKEEGGRREEDGRGSEGGRVIGGLCWWEVLGSVSGRPSAQEVSPFRGIDLTVGILRQLYWRGKVRANG